MTGCPKKPPATPGAPTGPDSTWTGVSAVFHVTTTAKSNIRYVMNWSDKTDTTADSYASAETAAMSHMWNTAGTYDVKVQGILDAEPTKASDWSPTKAVKVILNGAPKVDAVDVPPVAVKDVEAFFTVHGSDPDNDSIRVLVDWGSKDTTTEYFLSPCSVVVSHTFTKLETAMVTVQIQDWKGTPSAPDTVLVPVGTAGGVVWYWQSSDAENGGGPLTTSAVVASVGTEERLFSGCEDDYKFYSIRTSDGKGAHNATTHYPENSFTGHPGLANGHIIVGSEEGELYALKLDGLGRDWQWPNKNNEESLTGIEWGAPAFNNDKIYIGHDDDSLFLFQDAGSQGNRIAAYGVHATVVDAPIIDATGNVIFGTDSGYLVKMDGNLAPSWRAPLLGNGEVHAPILGADGTIYCSSDSSRLYAIDPATGSVKSGWPLTLDGDVFRLALGQSAIFVGSSFGKAYSINPATGSINWEESISPTAGFYTSPLVAANGYVYFQDDNDVLFCVNQADGTVIWSCDCPSFLRPARSGNSHRPRKLQLSDYAANPSIASNGNIIVVGAEACYCVAGYPEGPLDGAAAWPMWQKNLSNTGK
jgi:outer membrane protein assembly factor BamB